MISVSAGDYHGGQYLMGGLSALGQGLGEALQRYHYFYGDNVKVEVPVGSGRFMNLTEAAAELAGRLANLFLPDKNGRRACHGDQTRYATDPHWRDLVLFNEYFHGDNGRGCGASHQTGWTALVARLLQKFATSRSTTKPVRAAAAVNR